MPKIPTHMLDMIPYLLERRIVPKVWGGRALEERLGIALPAGESVGETWELFDRPDGASRLAGREATVHDLLRQDPVALLGRGVAPAPGGRFPLALKLLDAAEPLSIQVHPDDVQAREVGECGKAEAWVVLHAGPRACIRRGFVAGADEATFRACAHTEGVLDVLTTFAPSAGDAVHVPPGTVHALGPDIVVFEIQRNSDVTYRLWDWGRDRPMQVEEGLRATRFGCAPETTVAPEPIPGGGAWVVRDPCFRVRRLTLQERIPLGTEGTFKVLTLLRGELGVGWRSGGQDAPLRARQGDSVLVPAATGVVFLSPVGETELLVSDPGEVA